MKFQEKYFKYLSVVSNVINMYWTVTFIWDGESECVVIHESIPRKSP